MAQKFEELIAWQKARVLTNYIYSFTEERSVARDFGYRDQLRRASVSIMSNIAEGFGHSSNRQFHKYLSISKASTLEVQSLLYVALDANYIKEAEFNKLYNLSTEVVSIISGLQRYLNKKPN